MIAVYHTCVTPSDLISESALTVKLLNFPQPFSAMVPLCLFVELKFPKRRGRTWYITNLDLNFKFCFALDEIFVLPLLEILKLSIHTIPCDGTINPNSFNVSVATISEE